MGFVGQEPILFDATVKENATWLERRNLQAPSGSKVMYGLEDGETASAEHLENCKKMANLTFIDNQKALCHI